MGRILATVYLISCDDLGFVKIGVAKDPKSRMASLQTGCPKKLRLCRLSAPLPLDRARKLEREMHFAFAPRKACGEWFKMKPEDAAKTFNAVRSSATRKGPSDGLKHIRKLVAERGYALFWEGHIPE